ncbi:MAG: XDD3 family exosortase-dependent surface protein [Cyanobacteria bacterium J06626_6]
MMRKTMLTAGMVAAALCSAPAALATPVSESTAQSAVSADNTAIDIPTHESLISVPNPARADSSESADGESSNGDFSAGKWTYSVDAVGDSNDGAIYDIRAIGIKETPDKVIVSISANFPLVGVTNPNADDHEIGWGDLFFDFTDTTFDQANANRSLFAVKFAPNSNSGVSQTGVYGDASAKSVGAQNNGFRTLEEYFDAGLERVNTLGSSLVDRQSAYRYYSGPGKSGETTINNVIDNGTRLGDIQLLSEQEAIAAGVDFSMVESPGDVMITFQFDRDLLPAGPYVSNLFVECANDGVALIGNLPPERPNPSGVGGGGAAAILPSARLAYSVQTISYPPSHTPPTHSTPDEPTPEDPTPKGPEENPPEPKSVPEPSAIAGLALLGFFCSRYRRQVK